MAQRPGVEKPRDRMERRHVREKAVIDHLAEKVYDPAATGGDGSATQDPKTSTGLPVEGQIRKTWNPREGGLPTFCRK
jgi:hypothetical protein